MNKKIVVFGPGPLFKGGIANYNTSLAKAFNDIDNIEVHIVSWTQQYPSIIPRDFIDRKSKYNIIDNTNIKIHYITNYNNPISWHKTFKLIKKINPKMVIFQWAIAIQGLPIGYIARKLYKHTNIEIIFDLHFVIQKENSKIDKIFTKYGIKIAHKYIVHSLKTANELSSLFPKTKFAIVKDNKSTSPLECVKPIIKLYHPVYNMFKINPNLNIEETKQKLNLNKYVFLFFGFIRKYKGLHNVIHAFAKVAQQRNDVSLLIVGESFWQTLNDNKFSTKLKKLLFNSLKSLFIKKNDDEKNYRPLDLIEHYKIKDKVTVINDFVPNEDVHKYFQVSNCIVLFYITATPSGVESISYNFGIPIIATKVGHFPETIKDGYNGYLAEPNDINSMAETMLKIIEQPINKQNVFNASKDMSWENYAKAIWY